MGYSSANWPGDTLVIDTIGPRDDSWVDQVCLENEMSLQHMK
jgi:hypothetical protein